MLFYWIVYNEVWINIWFYFSVILYGEKLKVDDNIMVFCWDMNNIGKILGLWGCI